ncbi:MAG: hypothetical protein ACKVOS_03620 [Sphingorhabdus sp.]|uniref:hypothetical protein n=1 Tax=Sphingorhabdus sp. TaxID=1902408 RepID=UPI0038FBFA3F
MIMSLLAKSALSGVIVLLILMVANTNLKLAGWLTAMPMITALSLGWLWLEGNRSPVMTTYLTGVLIGVGHTAILLGTILLRVKAGASLPMSLLTGAVVWAFASMVIYQAKII